MSAVESVFNCVASLMYVTFHNYTSRRVHDNSEAFAYLDFALVIQDLDKPLLLS